MKNQQKLSTQEESNDQMNCTCQILNDTQLSNVGDTDCSCSQCLQANLDAFNQFKDTQQKQKLKAARSLDKFTSKSNKRSGLQDNTKSKFRDASIYNRRTNQSPNKINSKTAILNIKKVFPQTNGNIRNEHQHFTSQNINDFISITKQRTRQYISQRNKLQKQNKKQKEQLKQKIKENLQILKYTVRNIQENEKRIQCQEDDQDKQNHENQFRHKYKWNHQPVVFKQPKLNGNKKQCKRQEKKRKTVDTNLKQLIPQFQTNRNDLLQVAKQKRLQKFKQCKGCPYDVCPNHHMRTQKTKLIKIQKFIKKELQKYIQKKKKQKLSKQEKQKIRKAKLRAIDLKCKQKLAKSKRYDPSQSRTSFHLSIDHFSTFSELKAHKIQIVQQKQHKKQVRKMIKQKGGRLQEAIYQEIFQEQGQNFEKKNVFGVQKQLIGSASYEQKKPYCEKIMRQTKIDSPKRIKQGDMLHKRGNTKKGIINQTEQKKRTKQIEMQIQRTKRELMGQYRRQKQLNEVKNQKLKNQFRNELHNQLRE